MKNRINRLALISMLSLFSCTKVLYTHEQVLGLYKTKQDVMKTFGIPTEKKITDSTEEWLYWYDRYDSFTKHTVEEFENTKTVSVADFNRYKRYLLFIFDRRGNVVGRDNQGVDLTIKKKDTVATIALIAVGAGLTFGVTAYVSNHLFDGFTPSY